MFSGHFLDPALDPAEVYIKRAEAPLRGCYPIDGIPTTPSHHEQRNVLVAKLSLFGRSGDTITARKWSSFTVGSDLEQAAMWGLLNYPVYPQQLLLVLLSSYHHMCNCGWYVAPGPWQAHSPINTDVRFTCNYNVRHECFSAALPHASSVNWPTADRKNPGFTWSEALPKVIDLRNEITSDLGSIIAGGYGDIFRGERRNNERAHQIVVEILKDKDTTKENPGRMSPGSRSVRLACYG